MTQKIFKGRNFSDAVKKFFDDNTSGALADPKVNYNNSEHRQYDDAVNELLDKYLKGKNITEEQMTIEQAQEVLQEIDNSTDPRILDFNAKIKRERWRYIRRYGPWRRGGVGDED